MEATDRFKEAEFCSFNQFNKVFGCVEEGIRNEFLLQHSHSTRDLRRVPTKIASGVRAALKTLERSRRKHQQRCLRRLRSQIVCVQEGIDKLFLLGHNQSVRTSSDKSCAS